MAETKWEKWQVIGASPHAHKISNCIITSEKAKILHIFILQEMTILSHLNFDRRSQCRNLEAILNFGRKWGEVL